jgi:hypothetical protein
MGSIIWVMRSCARFQSDDKNKGIILSVLLFYQKRKGRRKREAKLVE